MADGYDVTAGELNSHATKVDGHGKTIGQAVDAANQAMPDNAYGIICQFLPPVINPIEQEAHKALKASDGGLSEIAKNLRLTAEGYQRNDEAKKNTFDRLYGNR
ncbi:excreted virulence factor EspC (type VII ESX diderm) [Herbihabitans rhizosphaerae]|uniref:Excreted virulence factor EspC (Type VII ESX diderm) n=1 Tax=Herbihabitans rhizosphaerae TaxID=1872711 RepID=A0A4Q7KBN2_9PSEU|nr:type VII secretion target [Herbihabitans rhizosphaerae]RZS29534.1 excreted virulence factor EspC (type VII ESX diderm) [Herbihabitans rhizosphaerae]